MEFIPGVKAVETSDLFYKRQGLLNCYFCNVLYLLKNRAQKDTTWNGLFSILVLSNAMKYISGESFSSETKLTQELSAFLDNKRRELSSILHSTIELTSSNLPLHIRREVQCHPNLFIIRTIVGKFDFDLLTVVYSPISMTPPYRRKELIETWISIHHQLLTNSFNMHTKLASVLATALINGVICDILSQDKELIQKDVLGYLIKRKWTLRFYLKELINLCSHVCPQDQVALMRAHLPLWILESISTSSGRQLISLLTCSDMELECLRVVSVTNST